MGDGGEDRSHLRILCVTNTFHICDLVSVGDAGHGKKKHIGMVVTAAIGEALVFFVFKKKKQNRTNNGWLQARSLHRERSAQRSAS